MSKKSRQKLRILHFLELMCNETDEESTLTLNEIQRKLSLYGHHDIDRKTIYDDIETLREFGMEIVMAQEFNPRRWAYYAENGPLRFAV
jgi:predicted DNA-binding transcriptional regulator YafY